jgi:hypothetical protein
MAIPAIIGHPDLYPVLQILIDGEELLARPYSKFGAYIGSPPAALLDDGVPLLPARRARRVALYIDSAGDPRGGCLAPVIGLVGDLVTWTDFRIFFAVEDAPFIWESGDDGSRVDVPDLAFGAQQYTDEVSRAAGEREWESEPWQTARLLDTCLTGLPIGEVWELGWVEPGSDGRFVVTLWDENLVERLEVTLTPASGGPHQRAAAMARHLLDNPPGPRSGT